MAQQSTVKVNLPSIDALAKTLNYELKVPLGGAASAVAGEIRKRWVNGIGANGAPMDAEKPISPEWKRQKELGGRAPKINYSWHGDFVQSFIPRKYEQNGKNPFWVIGFGGLSKGISRIKESDALDIALSGKSEKGKKKALSSLGNQSTKYVPNAVKARGLAHYRPKSFLPDDALRKMAITAFNRALRKMVPFDKTSVE